MSLPTVRQWSIGSHFGPSALIIREMASVPPAVVDLSSQVDRLSKQLINRALGMTVDVYEQRIATVTEDEKAAPTSTPKDRSRLEKLKRKAGSGSTRRAKALQAEGSSVVVRDIAGARFVSRYDARIVERVRLAA
jgi:hypothetical protein